MAIVMEWAKVAGRLRTNRYGRELIGEKAANNKSSVNIKSDDLIKDTIDFIDSELKKYKTE